ncbi:MAG: hypothetical protein C0424_04705 [Sphingobacteriaceae bacterium]|nr:hypothetical protein [Sphingobacteriaceae bacterium]
MHHQHLRFRFAVQQGVWREVYAKESFIYNVCTDTTGQLVWRKPFKADNEVQLIATMVEALLLGEGLMANFNLRGLQLIARNMPQA